MISKKIPATDKDGQTVEVTIREWTGADLRRMREKQTGWDEDLVINGLPADVVDRLTYSEIKRLNKSIVALSTADTDKAGN